MPTKINLRPQFATRIEEAAALQQRIAAGQATARETQHYERMIREFRRKYQNGQLSEQSARQLGIA
jgi:transcription elongation GreA/GreB family factor